MRLEPDDDVIEGPFLVEMLTYRIGGHSTSDDPRAYRAKDEVESWRSTDPLIRGRQHLDTLDAWSDAEDEAFRKETEAELKACIAKAEEKDKPTLSTMFEGVYEEKPWHLREQQEQCENGPRAKEHH